MVDISSAECRRQSADCLLLRTQAGISPPRAKMLLTMARTWTALASQKERLALLTMPGDTGNIVPVDAGHAPTSAQPRRLV